MAKTSTGLRAWRRRQKKHSIMTPEKFEQIKSKASVSGATNPETVAGAAYWRTAEKKYQSSLRAKSKQLKMKRKK